ncbi:MAG: OmpH family outer membrane protein [Bacteroidota bacterium]|nr:OmpH family outer membrane protein [Bacteroidota bacterium]
MKNLKYFTAVIVFSFLFFSTAQAQRFSYVDTEYILEKMPEYRSAQKQLDNLAKQWKDEVKIKMQEVEKLYNNYKAEQVLLPEDVRKKKEESILKKEDELNKLKQQKFGKEGELFKKRKELIKPIQDKVFDAVQKLAQDEGLDFIFDKAGAVTMLYVNAKYDRSDEVLDILGIEVKKK